MLTIKRSIQVMSLLPLLALTACGEGYEMRPYHGTPFDGRTAGAGVEYVLAKMMPKKGAVLESAMPKAEEKPAVKEEVKAPEAVPPPAAAPEVKDAEPLFNRMFNRKMNK